MILIQGSNFLALSCSMQHQLSGMTTPCSLSTKGQAAALVIFKTKYFNYLDIDFSGLFQPKSTWSSLLQIAGTWRGKTDLGWNRRLPFLQLFQLMVNQCTISTLSSAWIKMMINCRVELWITKILCWIFINKLLKDLNNRLIRLADETCGRTIFLFVFVISGS